MPYSGNVKDGTAVRNLTMLLEASREGHSSIVSLLLEHRANVNWQDSNGGTALMYSIRHQDATILRALLDAGAELGLRCGEQDALAFA